MYLGTAGDPGLQAPEPLASLVGAGEADAGLEVGEDGAPLHPPPPPLVPQPSLPAFPVS